MWFKFLLAAIWLVFCGPASAWVHGSAVTSFNGGKSQIGVNFLQISNDFAFMNAMKGAQNWTYSDNTGKPAPDELDADGYPVPGANCFSHGGVYTIFYVPLQSERPGNYAATWSGQNTLRTGMSATVLPTATFTGSIAAGILTAGAPSGGTIQKGTSLTGTGVASGTVVGDQITGTAGESGTYFVTGTITASSTSMTVDGGSKTGTGTNRFVFSTTSYRFDIGFSAATTTPSDLKVFHVDDEAELNAGRILGKKFRQNWAYMNAGVIRFGDWQGMNTTSVTTWATRKPVSYVYYSGTDYRPSLYAGITTNVGDAYSAGAPPAGFTLTDKATVIVKFNATASGNTPTLDVAGTGAIAIKDHFGDTIAFSVRRPTANAVGTLIYDATLNAWIKQGGDTDRGDVGIGNGVPPETMLQVAVELGAHAYVTTPYLSIDPITDYMPSMAAYFRDNAPSWMIPRYEGPNEAWNSASSFYATRYGWNKAFAYWATSNDTHNWYGKAISLLGQAVSTVYSGNRSRYQVIAGVQTASGCANDACSSSATSVSNVRLTSALWISSGPSQSGYSNTAGVGEAYRWVTHVAMANYVTPVAYGTLQELRDGYAYVVTNAGNPSAQAALADTYVDTLSGAAAPFNLNYVKAAAQFWYAWAQNNWGGSINLPLTAYEGGYSPDYSQNEWTSPVTGATQANPCVLTLATTSGTRGTISGGGNPAVIGMQISLASVGGMTQLNGNTYTVTAVAGNSVTINVDSSAFSAFTSGGTATYVNAPLYTNTLRWASKFSSHLQTQMTQSYADMAAVPMVFPSQFNFSGPSINNDLRPSSGTIGAGGGQVWGLWDQSVYATPYSPAVESIRQFNLNFLLERDVEPVSNDNYPMGLEKAA
jgi:hypothetical protein